MDFPHSMNMDAAMLWRTCAHFLVDHQIVAGQSPPGVEVASGVAEVSPFAAGLHEIDAPKGSNLLPYTWQGRSSYGVFRSGSIRPWEFRKKP